MDVGQTIHRPNPFATRYIASARLLPRDEQGGVLNLASLVARLDALGGSGAIVGPHGTGKSTVLSHLGDFIATGKRPVARVRLRSRRDIPAAVRSVRKASRDGLLCIDSWELLGFAGRAVVRGLARVRGVGLLVTSHGPAGLPTLISCRGTRALLGALVGELPDHDEWFGRTIVAADLDAALGAANGDVRQALDRLYDRFERGRQQLPQ